ncbi:uncharacterized protein LOC126749251 [Anthonomus grandis grandis]|uniref:uncharacterized protein LOC126749251 n=1 Tax=Anthonomus grandis grandis TaxID=2921223 RepID=UPI002165A46B|nr:uncharacterized protein LOC126749251 [Anthonomus grandis grandis]
MQQAFLNFCNILTLNETEASEQGRCLWIASAGLEPLLDITACGPSVAGCWGDGFLSYKKLQLHHNPQLHRIIKHQPGPNLLMRSFVVSASFDNPATAQISKGFVYAPVIEVPHEEAFLTEKQWGLFESGRYNKVPIFIGMTSEESMTLMHANSTETWDAYDNNPSIMVPYDLHITNTDIKKSIGWEIWNQFTDGEGFNNDLVKGIRYHSVHDFDKASIKQAELMSNHSDVYFYQFSYSGLMGYFGYRLAGCGNVSHAEELYYLFSKWYSNDIPDNTDMSYFPEADQKVHFRIMALWTNFAKYLNPTPPFVDVDLLQNVTWELVKPNEFRYLDIEKDLIMVTGYPKEKKYLFWDTLYKKYAVPPLDTF